MRMGSDEVEAAKVTTFRDCCDSLELPLAKNFGHDIKPYRCHCEGVCVERWFAVVITSASECQSIVYSANVALFD